MLVLLPLSLVSQVVGVVGVDTLLSATPTQFLPHEIAFIQVTAFEMRHRFKTPVGELNRLGVP